MSEGKAPAKFDDAQVLDQETRVFLNCLADAMQSMRDRQRVSTRDKARPKSDRAEVSVTNEALYKLGLKQFLARPDEVKRAPRTTRGTNTVVGGDASLKASLKASLSRAQSSFELKKMRGR
jgi:hypothetical protein